MEIDTILVSQIQSMAEDFLEVEKIIRGLYVDLERNPIDYAHKNEHLELTITRMFEKLRQNYFTLLRCEKWKVPLDNDNDRKLD
ncbi:MAG: hypothetical protein KGI54_14805 [Pseudomonadota bacterium]|nr:hypothetical protein [Pseudomonadota bacterium]